MLIILNYPVHENSILDDLKESGSLVYGPGAKDDAGGKTNIQYTVCPRSSDPFYVVTHYIKWVTTSWTYSKKNPQKTKKCKHLNSLVYTICE